MVDKIKKILEAKQKAILNGGICLSDKYTNVTDKLEWKCLNPNHPSWFSSFNSIVNNKCWCPNCGIESQIGKRKKKNGLEQAQLHAQSKSGCCLSTEYINVDSKLEWKCSNPQHPLWLASFYNVVSRKCWCRLCSIVYTSEKRKKKDGLEQAQLYAAKKGGSCLSTEYVASRDKLEWKCSNPIHPSWFSAYDTIINGNHWCLHCFNDENAASRKIEGLKKAHKYAQSRGGICLSTDYFNGQTKLEWKCANENHPSWVRDFHSVTSKKSWCAKCVGESVQEFKVRNILNYLFNTNFINTRLLDWNINPTTNRNLELDGYCDNLKIAFEFQGEHHNELAFRNTQSELEYIQAKDSIKKQNCINNNVKLIIIHEIKKKNFNDFYAEIIRGIEETGINIHEDRKNNILKLKKLYNLNPINNKQKEYLKEAKNYALTQNGQCLSKEYKNSKEKLQWKCSNLSHPAWFNLFHSVVKLNRWCRQCSIEQRTKNKTL